MKAFNYFAMTVLALGLASIPVAAQEQPQSQPEQQPSQSQPAQTADPSATQAHAFTGKIVKTGGVLKLQDDTGKMSYNLDDQKQAKSFSGKNVKVSGTLDSTTNTIHITNIELMSRSY